LAVSFQQSRSIGHWTLVIEHCPSVIWLTADC